MDFFWEKAGWEEQDRHLSEVAAMPFRRNFPLLPELPGLHIIRGPRQVGKSSWLKTILKHYAKLELCFFLSCEEVESFKELGEILRSVKNRRVILIDEINFVDGWDRAVKHFIDSGPDRLMVVTGSHAHDLKKGADRMPGRFGGGGEYTLLPMGFDEFCKARSQAGWSCKDRLSELRAYFRIGGFPRAVAEANVESKLPVAAIETYWRWLRGDITKLGKQESYLTEILLQVALTLQTPISFQTLAQRTSIGSHNTIQEYISVLESCFALRQLLAIDLNSGAYRYRKGRKFYFTDPLLYHLALRLASQPLPEDFEARMAEMVANEHLARIYPRFGYFSGPSGEVDFMLQKQWSLEVKWSQVASNLSKAYLQSTAPWKSVWTQENFLRDFPPISR